MEPSLATDPTALTSARDQIYGALGSEDPPAALRSVALDVAARLGRAHVESVFALVCEELVEADRSEESELVAQVLDMMAEW